MENFVISGVNLVKIVVILNILLFLLSLITMITKNKTLPYVTIIGFLSVLLITTISLSFLRDLGSRSWANAQKPLFLLLLGLNFFSSLLSGFLTFKKELLK